MSLDIYSQFIVQPQEVATQKIAMTNTMPSLIDINPDDIFTPENTEKATSAGLILAIGMFLREVLKELSDGFFAKYFSKNQNIDEKEMKIIAKNMLENKKLMQDIGVSNRVKINGEFAPEVAEGWKSTTGKGPLKNVIINKNGQDAYFTHVNNYIKVTKDTLISLPHEIGHAVEENSTKFLKKLQRSRGKYAALALILYGLGREKPANTKGGQTLWGKFQNFLYKYNLLVPLIAFSPELITEFAASKIGIDYIKEHIKNLKTDTVKNAKSIAKSKNILKVAKKHYAVAFCTYLSLPLFAILDNYIFKKATKN